MQHAKSQTKEKHHEFEKSGQVLKANEIDERYN